MSFVVTTMALFIGAGALIGLLVGTVMIKLSTRARMWGLRLLTAVSLLPILGAAGLARAYAMGEGASYYPGLEAFLPVTILVILVAMGTGWVLGSFCPPLVAVSPLAAFVGFYHLALAPIFTTRFITKGPPDLVFISEVGATVFLLVVGWMVWKANKADGLTPVSAGHE